jgi:hypothetical protein
VANRLNLQRTWASLLANAFGVGFIGWLGLAVCGIGEPIDFHRTLYTMQLALNRGQQLEAA